MNTKKKKLIIGIVLICLIILLYFSGIQNYINFETFKSHRDYLLNLVHEHFFYTACGYILLYAAIVISSLPIAGIFSVVSGFLFGVFYGAIFTVLGGILGSIVSFLLFRYLLGRFIQNKHSKRLDKFNKSIEEYGALYLLTIQFASIFPFFIINSLAAMTSIPLKTFAWTTAVGIIPSAILYAYAGRQLAEINSFSEILSPHVLMAFFLLALFGIVSILIKKYKH